MRRPTLISLWYGVLAVAVPLALTDLLLPPPLERAFSGGSTLVLARDGSPLRAFVGEAGTWRYPVSPADVSPYYLEALLGYEDRWFYTHPGVNPPALLRAVLQALRSGEVISGGSTLTMQVARLIEPIPRTAFGKLIQMARALQIERRLSKEQILAIYLERAPFGGTIEGVEAASWAYLGKPSKRLSRAEAALLAVLPQAPSRLRPDRHADAAGLARDKVIRRLQVQGQWDPEAVKEAAAEPVVARRLVPPMQAALLAERMLREHPDERIVRTSIDPVLQRLVENRVQQRLASLPPRTSAAALLVDNQTSEVLVYVGSAKFGDEARLGHVDMISARRSPGSTLKPLLWGFALDAGLIHSASLLIDAPQSFDGYRPANFGDFFHGPVSATEALQRSLNVPAVDLLRRVTPQAFTAGLRHGGVQLALPRGAEPNLAIILGGVGARMDELIGAYTALSNRGLAGRVLFRPEAPQERRRIMSEGAAWIVRDMLEKSPLPDELAMRPSTRTRLAWKTGTSFGYRDAWAFGVTPTFTLAVWIGRPDGTPLPGQFGAATALPVLVALVDALPASPSDRAAAKRPDSVTDARICWPTGIPEPEKRASLCHQSMDALILDGNLPPTLPPVEAPGEGSDAQRVVSVQIDAQSGLRVSPDCAGKDSAVLQIARWPRAVEPWLDAAQKSRSLLPAWKAGCRRADESGNTLLIEGIAPGTVLRAAPGSTQPPGVTLRVRGTTEAVDWLVNDIRIVNQAANRRFDYRLERPGVHRIVVIDTAGRWASLSVRLRSEPVTPDAG